MDSDLVVNTFETFIAQSQWSPWLSTELDVGYNTYKDDHTADSLTYLTPNNASNPFPGQWTLEQGGAFPAQDKEEPSRTKSLRFSILATNDLFGGRAHSQSILGADYGRTD